MKIYAIEEGRHAIGKPIIVLRGVAVSLESAVIWCARQQGIVGDAAHDLFKITKLREKVEGGWRLDRDANNWYFITEHTAIV